MRYEHGQHGHPLLPAVVSLSADKVRSEVANRAAKSQRLDSSMLSVGLRTRAGVPRPREQTQEEPSDRERLPFVFPFSNHGASMRFLGRDQRPAAQSPLSLQGRLYAECESALSAAAKPNNGGG